METNLLLFLLVLAFAFLIFLQVQVSSFKKRINELFGKKKGKDIEKVLEDYVKGVKRYFDDVEELKGFSSKLFKIGERSLQKVGIVRFNPFGDVGGNQSFSIAFLDLKNNGVLVTSLFGRDGTRVYSKPINRGKSEHFLSEEEKEAVKKAINSTAKSAKISQNPQNEN